MSNEVFKVMTDEEWAGLTEESRKNLVDLFGYNQFPPPYPGRYTVRFDEREDGVLRALCLKWDMSIEAVVKKLVRLGQLSQHYMEHGYKINFVRGDEVIDPFEREPMLAPMPTPNIDANDDLAWIINLLRTNANNWLMTTSPSMKSLYYTTLRSHALVLREDFDADAQPVVAPEPPSAVDGHVDCLCWTTGLYKRVEGCELHPYDL